MEWSPQQDAALRAAARWLRDPSGQQVFRIMGYVALEKYALQSGGVERLKDG